MTKGKDGKERIFLKERDGQYGKFFSKNMGSREAPDYLNASVQQDGSLQVKYGGDKFSFDRKEGKFGPFYVVDVLDRTWFATTGSSQYGPYLQLKEAPPKSEAPPERPENYGSRG